MNATTQNAAADAAFAAFKDAEAAMFAAEAAYAAEMSAVACTMKWDADQDDPRDIE